MQRAPDPDAALLRTAAQRPGRSAGNDRGVAAGPGVEAIPGRLCFALAGEQPCRVAELARARLIGPGEPPDATDVPAVAVARQQREGAVQFACLAVRPPLPTGLEAGGTPAHL